jgi:hypothetical protein
VYLLAGRPTGSGRVGPQRPHARPEGRSAAGGPRSGAPLKKVQKVLIRRGWLYLVVSRVMPDTPVSVGGPAAYFQPQTYLAVVSFLVSFTYVRDRSGPYPSSTLAQVTAPADLP